MSSKNRTIFTGISGFFGVYLLVFVAVCLLLDVCLRDAGGAIFSSWSILGVSSCVVVVVVVVIVSVFFCF